MTWRLSSEVLRSPSLAGELPYQLCLPPSALSSATTPMVLLLHGSGGTERSWDQGIDALQHAVVQGDLPPIAAIAPGTGTSWWVDGPSAVETAVITELIPSVVEATGLGRGGLFVAGFSMGGFGAVRYALRYPYLFSGAIALSSALYADLPPLGSSARTSGAFGTPFDARRWTDQNYPALLEAYGFAGRQVPLFIAAGDADWNEPSGWGFNTEYQSVVLFERLNKEMGSPARLRIDAGGHDWAYWRPMFITGLKYLLACASSASRRPGARHDGG